MSKFTCRANYEGRILGTMLSMLRCWQETRTPAKERGDEVNVVGRMGARLIRGLRFRNGRRLSLKVNVSSFDCTGWKRKTVMSTKVSSAPLIICIMDFKGLLLSSNTPFTDTNTSPQASFANALPLGRTSLIMGRPILGPWPTLSSVIPIP